MTVFTNSANPNPYVSFFPKNNIGGIVRLDGTHKIACFQPPMDVSVHIAYTAARLFKNKCVPCPYLEPTEIIEQTGDLSLRTCEGFFKMHKYYYSTCKTNSAQDLDVVKINVPATMWVVGFDNKFRFYTVKTVGGVLYKIPYTLANVYSNGDICWGNSNKLPGDLRDAVQKYWTLPFNSDLMGHGLGEREDGDLSTKLSTFKIDDSDVNVLERWHDTSDVVGNGCVYKQEQVDGVSLWFDETTLSLLPKDKIFQVRRKMKDGSILNRCAVGWINTLDNQSGHIINFDGFRIIKDKLTIKSKTMVLGSK